MVVVVVVVNTKPSGLAKAAAATAGNGSSWGFAAVRRKSCGRASGHTRRGRESMDVRDVIYGIGRRLVGFRESQLFCGWVFDFKSYDALTIGVTFVVYIWSQLRCPATAGSACTTDSDIWPDRAHEQNPCYPTPSGADIPSKTGYALLCIQRLHAVCDLSPKNHARTNFVWPKGRWNDLKNVDTNSTDVGWITTYRKGTVLLDTSHLIDHEAFL